ncbi:helix-turn-helix transcriptional regulator [Bosea sp. (in: a-proteobacteria)]|jgi:transcriptional regulator with XRE-family HTH domain|uniref:helix-turn-helix domain-containing protein n=1 Tax=Bosea sp. (in: a-proteobacteria) TaxID=1871050 RepID=UPI002DDD1176|nr:helix-turn-helix transcriptional regulator [Bosea sp. (in: a-proteobacteria)]HEV2510207.1 helix-turn-helix transcriptional regulator [Bosea sp. (in: a-proteobacteria)]
MDRDWRAEFKRIVGDRMRRLRLVSRLKRAEVARALHVSEEQYLSYERGLSHASSQFLMQFSSFLGTSPRELGKGMAALVTSAGLADVEQKLYRIEPAAASRSRVNKATEKIRDQGTLSALACLTEFFAELDDRET